MGIKHNTRLKFVVRSIILIFIIFLGLIWIQSSSTMIQNPRLTDESIGGIWAYEDVNTEERSLSIKLLATPTFNNDSIGESSWVIQLFTQIDDGIKMHQKVEYFLSITANYSDDDLEYFGSLPTSYISVDDNINLVYVPSNVKYSLDNNQKVIDNYTQIAFLNSEQNNLDADRIDQRIELVMKFNDSMVKQWYDGVCDGENCLSIQTLRVRVIVKYYEEAPFMGWGSPEVYEFIIGDGDVPGDVTAIWLYPI